MRRLLIGGLAGTFVAVVVWLLVTVVVPVGWTIITSRLAGQSGVAVAYVDSTPLLVVATVGFVAGVAWRSWRVRRTRQ